MDPIIGGALIGGAVSGIGMLGQRRRERRALRNQKDLMGIQHVNQRNLNSQQYSNQSKLNQEGQELGMKTWKETSYGPQMKMMKEAGLNPALMYGMSGGGGQTVASPSGGSASAGGASGGQAPAPQPMELGNMLMGAQMGLLKAQTEKTKTETANIGEQTGKTHQEGLSVYLDNLVKKFSMSDQKDRGVNNSERYGEGGVSESSPLGKQLVAEADAKVVELSRARVEKNIADAEKIVRDFEADLAKQGISSNSPFWVKLMTDVLKKAGVLEWLRPSSKDVKADVSPR